MTKYIDTKSYRAASEKATISVTKYTDTNLGPHYFWRITIKRDRDELGRILEDQRLTPPSRRTIIRILSQN